MNTRRRKEARIDLRLRAGALVKRF